jgi:hypothetical protein
MTDAMLSKGLLLVRASRKSWSGKLSNIVLAFWIPNSNSVETNLSKRSKDIDIFRAREGICGLVELDLE